VRFASCPDSIKVGGGGKSLMILDFEFWILNEEVEETR
jgi:hypothetical protein